MKKKRARTNTEGDEVKHTKNWKTYNLQVYRPIADRVRQAAKKSNITAVELASRIIQQALDKGELVIQREDVVIRLDDDDE